MLARMAFSATPLAHADDPTDTLIRNWTGWLVTTTGVKTVDAVVVLTAVPRLKNEICQLLLLGQRPGQIAETLHESAPTFTRQQAINRLGLPQLSHHGGRFVGRCDGRVGAATGVAG